MSRAELESLLATLRVDFVKLAECVVATGWRLVLPAADVAALHYNVAGTGLMTVEGYPPFAIRPHTLAIAPPGRSFSIDAPSDGPVARVATVDSRSPSFPPGALRRRVAGEGEPAQIIMICGYFQASCGPSTPLFGPATGPIVEQFDETHGLGDWLKTALDELVAQEMGMNTMATCLLKQVLVALLRRSLLSANPWVERFPALRDPRVARAFTEMAARPGLPHTIQELAQEAGLSRSAFMARFAASFGKSPMLVLRDLRMRQAAELMQAGELAIEEIAQEVGYASRNGFLRAYRKVYGGDPPIS